MKPKTVLGILTVVAALALSGLAQASTVVLTLNRVGALTNVPDAAGTSQYEGGTVFKGTTQVGYYAISRRTVNGGTTAQNTAMTTCQLFFLGVSPPENVVIQGSHSFTSGQFRGAVSAASYKYTWLMDTSDYVVYAPTAVAGQLTLTIVWQGSPTVTLP